MHIPTAYLCAVEKEVQIMQAALLLLIENGTQSTPMSAIARAAHTGMGTIYHYFPTKESLINAIYGYVKREQLRSVALPPATASVKQQFDHYYLGMMSYLLAEPAHFRFMNQYHSSPVLTAETFAEGLAAIAPITELLVAGQAQGLVKDIGASELLEFLNGGMMGFVRWVVADGQVPGKQLLANQLRIAWDAIKQ